MKQSTITRYLLALLLATFLSTSVCDITDLAAQPMISLHGEGYHLYSYKDYEMSGQKHIHRMQEKCEGFGMAAKVGRDMLGLIATETDYTYLAFNLDIADSLVLHIPKGPGNFTLVMLGDDGTEYLSDEGVFIFRKGKMDIKALANIGPDAQSLFVNPDRVMLNRSDEPRVIIRFAKGINLDRIVSITVSDRVGVIARTT